MASSTKEKEIKDVQLPFNVRLLQIGHTFIEWSQTVCSWFSAQHPKAGRNTQHPEVDHHEEG